MTFNNNSAIRFYLLTIIIIVSCVFGAFLLANYYATQKNTSRIVILQEKEFPLIQKLLQIQRETEQLRALFSDAVSFESEFLIQEANEHTALIEKLIDDINQLYSGDKNIAGNLRTALSYYNNLATILSDQMIESDGELDKFSESARRANDAFLNLEQVISITLGQQQERYTRYVEDMNLNFRNTHNSAALFGMVLIIILIVFSRIISSRIMFSIKKADHLKESFLLTISHELRTPLNGIKGAIDLMKTSDFNNEQKELIGIAKTSMTKMTQTVDDLLLFTELTTGNPIEVRSCYSLKDSIRDLLNYTEAQCLEKEINFSVDISLPTEKIECDHQKLSRTLWQLLKNAVYYTDKGTIYLKITANLNDTESSNGSLTVTIIDDGSGISEQYLDKLFIPFEQQNIGWNREHQGIGIGLPMANKLVECLKGQLEIQNREDAHGVKASFTIPCVFVTPGPIVIPLANDPNCLEQQPHNRKDKQSLGRALIVEDNKINQLILKKTVERLGLNTVIVENGYEAVQLIQKEQCSIIFMDCQMPVMNGFEATEKIRELGGEMKTIPIIAVTANTMDEDKRRCYSAGMTAVIEKPVNMNVIENIINTAIFCKSNEDLPILGDLGSAP